MLSVKQGGIKYRFLSLSYDSTWDWTPVSRNFGEHSTHWDKPFFIQIIDSYTASSIPAKYV